MGNCNGTEKGAPHCMASYKDHDISCKPPPKDGWSACYRKECIDGTIYDFSHAPGDDEKKRSLAGEADCKARGYEGIEDPGKQENWVNCEDFHFAFRCKGSLKKPDPPDAPATTTGAEDTNDDTPPTSPEPDLLTSLLSPTSLISFAAMAGFYFMSHGKKAAEADPLEALIARQNAALAPPPGATAPPPPLQAAAPAPPPPPQAPVPAPALPQDAPELFESADDEESSPLLLVVLVTAVVLGAIAWNREAVLQSIGSKKKDEDEDEKISG